MISEFLFPVCNHNGITECNIGYACGYTNYGPSLPFEMEVIRTDASDRLSIVLPRLYFNASPDPLDYDYIYAEPVMDDGPKDYYDILVRGMQYDGKVENPCYIEKWLDLLEKEELFSFKGEKKEACIDAFTDANGTKLIRLVVTLREENQVYAELLEEVSPFVNVKNGGHYMMFDPDLAEE